MVMLVHLISCVFLLSLCAPPSFSDVLRSGTFNSEEINCMNFFFEETPPEIPGILEKGTIRNNNAYKAICQRFENKYRFATLYDTGHKIPVFSAIKYEGKQQEESKKKLRDWRTEDDRQLEGLQATDDNYRFESDEKNVRTSTHDVTRGHLIPYSYGETSDDRRSTCTLTNVVPQKRTFNGGSWSIMEGRVRLLMDEECKDINDKTQAYVVTGAVPGNVKMNDTVNIPELMWTAMCCYNAKTKKWLSVAHWAPNVPENEEQGQARKKKKEQKEITAITLDELHTKLRDKGIYPTNRGSTFNVFPTGATKCYKGEGTFDLIVKKLKEYKVAVALSAFCCCGLAVAGCYTLCTSN